MTSLNILSKITDTLTTIVIKILSNLQVPVHMDFHLGMFCFLAHVTYNLTVVVASLHTYYQI